MTSHRVYTRIDPISGRAMKQCSCGASSPAHSFGQSLDAWATAHAAGAEANPDWWTGRAA